MRPPTSPASMRAARSAPSDSREKSTPTRIRIRPRATFGSYPFTRAIGTTRATRRESPSETAATSSRNDAAESCGEFLFASSYMSPRASPLRRPAESDGAGATLTKGGCHACCSGGNRPEDPAGRFARTLVELADGGAGQVTGEFVTHGCRHRPDRPPHARMGRAPARSEDPLHSLRRGVSLEGELSTLREKEDAERLVRVLAGVKGVHNLLTVAATSVDPRRLRTSIEEALELEAEREAEKISVNVEGGTVSLEGRVRTW